MSSKIAFVEAASQRGANIAALCREHGISRQSGYKYLRRFKRHGYAGLEEDSRRPSRVPLATAEDIVLAVIDARDRHPSFGAAKLVVILRRTLKSKTPSAQTVHRILKRVGAIRRRKRKTRVSVIENAPSVVASQPNDVWTIDFKGWWRAGDQTRCEPLTIRDAFSRFVFTVHLLPSTRSEEVRVVMASLFRKYGVPKAIQCDNGSPFISAQSRGGLTKLSAWWVSLGIRLVRSRPGCPQDNGGHERMHRDMLELQADPAASRALQQRACDRWKQVFNHVRPHAALNNKTPAEVYFAKASPKRSTKRSVVPPPPCYPLGWLKRTVSCNGSIRVWGVDHFISSAVGNFEVGLEPIDGLSHRVWFYEVDLGSIDLVSVTASQVQRSAS